MRTPVAMIAVLGIVAMVMQFQRSAHVVVAPIFTRELSISPQVLGGLSGAMLIASAIIQIPGGVLIDRYGARRMIAVLLLFAVAGAAVFGLATSAAGLVGGRILMGIGTALLLMSVAAVLSRWYGTTSFPAMLGLVGGIGQIGNLVATTPMGSLAEQVGWRNAYFIIALGTLLIVVLSFVFVRDAPAGSAYHARQRETLRETMNGVLEVIRIRSLYRLLPMSAAAWATISCVIGLWGGPFLADVHGFDTIARGNVMAVMAASSVVGAIAFGWASSRVPSPKPIIVFGVISNILIFALLAALASASVFVVAALLGALGFFGSYTSMLIAHGRHFYPERLTGRGLTVVNTAVLVGAAFMQWFTGLVVGAFPQVDGHAPPEAYRTVFGLLALFLVVALAIYWPLREQTGSLARS